MLRPLLRFVAGYTAQLAYTAKLARALGVANRTVDDYLYLLENMYLLERLPSFTGDFAKREIVGKPKFHLRDSGIACALLNLDAPALDADPVRRGHLLETFVLQELRRQASGSERPYRFSHYRTKRGVEVDIVVEGHSGDALAGVEVKASATLRQEHFKGLRKLRDKLGDSFAGGVVLHEGEHCLPYGDRLYGVPLRRLWDAAATG